MEITLSIFQLLGIYGVILVIATSISVWLARQGLKQFNFGKLWGWIYHREYIRVEQNIHVGMFIFNRIVWIGPFVRRMGDNF